eukprot:TRINITY_DN458_c2_g1_i1.p1 TRINITY_DN458_c2_g1~~TRINITY_DN458_c2_g1_i1.p1  ORF type:complete len:544 (+),score=109.10 TRINITY_DN458_c2_g1_i1:79-1710(+)
MSPVSAVSRKSFYLLAFLSMPVFAKHARHFLGARPAVEARGPADLLAELQSEEHLSEFDHVHMTTARTERLETALLPLFKIAAKDVNGRVDANAARYLLHRLFTDRHGWYVNGLNFQEVNTSASQLGKALYGGGDTFSLRQLARFAATLETTVHAENMKRLQKAFNLYGISRNYSYNERMATEVLESYLVFFMTITFPEDESYDELVDYCERIPEWSDTKLFANEIQQRVAETDGALSMSLWDFLLQVVGEIGERYGRWQNKHCLELKSKLMQMEVPGTGRVPLKSFWLPFLENPQWPFVETEESLRLMGALDDREPEHPYVMIPNYVYSSMNCLAGSTYYDVCCINECESLLGQIESRIDAPAATPRRLAETLLGLSSSTMDAPRESPAALMKRLESIANQYQGVVPLHGRLFAQLLHHAYPHECPYPHVSLQTLVETERRDMRIEEEARVTPEFVEEYLAREGIESSSLGATSELPWSEEEELFLKSLAFDVGGGGTSEVTMLVPLSALVLTALAVAIRFQKPLDMVLGVQGKGSRSAYVV